MMDSSYSHCMVSNTFYSTPHNHLFFYWLSVVPQLSYMKKVDENYRKISKNILKVETRSAFHGIWLFSLKRYILHQISDIKCGYRRWDVRHRSKIDLNRLLAQERFSFIFFSSLCFHLSLDKRVFLCLLSTTNYDCSLQTKLI